MAAFTYKEMMDILLDSERNYLNRMKESKTFGDKEYNRHAFYATREIKKKIQKEFAKKYNAS
jgi:hypothetical protein|tara:strand:+ start:17472 stop:17657 length:186 start_codon:yes stop_codon:yes gene_type:complete